MIPNTHENYSHGDHGTMNAMPISFNNIYIKVSNDHLHNIYINHINGHKPVQIKFSHFFVLPKSENNTLIHL